MVSSPSSTRIKVDDPVLPDQKTLLRFITCGSVDDGKSSLIGRVLFESGSVPDDQLVTLDTDSKKFGTQGAALDYALLVDGLSAEREQGITIDVAYRYFATSKRSFIVADTPGHEQYTRNMATGASNADLAIILVDARKGILPQTRRHSLIVSMVGVKNVIVAVKKMDLVDYSPFVFQAIEHAYHDIAKTLNIPNVIVIPVSAVAGDNIAAPSARTPWYNGPSLIEYLETVDVQSNASDAGFAMPVQWVNRPDSSFRGYSGLIASGRISPGDAITIVPGGREAIIDRIVTFDGDRDQAMTGQSVTLTLDREVDISRGDVISTISELVKAPDTVLDVETYQDKVVEKVGINAIFKTRVSFDRLIAVAPYNNNRDLGSFILIDRLSNEVVALGLVDGLIPSDLGKARTRVTLTSLPFRHDPLKRSLMKTSSFALGTLLLGFIMWPLSLKWPPALYGFAIAEIFFFLVHELLWARARWGLAGEVKFLSAGEGI